MHRKNLVLVRTGANSLHPNWLGANATWDLALSSYANENPSAYPEAAYFHYYKGGKWDGIAQFFEAYPQCLTQYDYIWLPDDDIDTDMAAIDALFAGIRHYDLAVMQPSLHPDSFFWHAITLHCALTRIRYTNFVEVMVPVLSTAILKELLPVFAKTKSGWGIDWLWADMAAARGQRVGIFDEVQVLHTRPVGSALAKEMKKEGLTGESELAAMGYSDARALCLAAILKGGLALNGQALCGVIQFLANAPWFSRGRHKLPGRRVFLGSLYSHFTVRHRLQFPAE